ncbi:MAG: TetR/AcrR family transcriptional regulator [Phycisphaerae bacterium]|nr:TetR/AcrR family transcriptional regulator [Phycisphaerae bacterium]
MANYNKTKRDLIESAFKSTTFDAAVNILKEEGLNGLQMQRIATETGVSTGTLYNYFENKQDLLIFVHERLCDEFFSLLAQASESNLKPDKKIIYLIRQVLDFIAANKDTFEFLELSGVFNKKENIRFEHQKNFIELFARVLQEGIDQQVFFNIDSYKAAELLHACIVGIFRVNTDFMGLQPEMDGEDLIKMFSAYLGITD